MVARARRGWIGIDLGSRSVKIAQIARGPEGLHLSAAAVVPCRIDSSGQPVATGDWHRELQTGLPLSGAEGHLAACALSMQWCQARSLMVAPGSPSEQRADVAQQLAEFAGDQNDLLFDFWPVAKGDESKAVSTPDHVGTEEPGAATPSSVASDTVVALAVPRGVASNALEEIGANGLVCQAFDGIPTALARAVALASPDVNGAQAALDWGFAEATFCCMLGSEVTFVRRLRGCGFGTVLRAAADALNLSVDEVEWLLLGATQSEDRHEDIPPEFADVICESAAPTVQVLVDELQRTLAFLHAHRTYGDPARLWLFGAGGAWPGVEDLLGARLKLPVRAWTLETAGIRSSVRAPAQGILAPAVALSLLAWEETA